MPTINDHTRNYIAKLLKETGVMLEDLLNKKKKDTDTCKTFVDHLKALQFWRKKGVKVPDFYKAHKKKINKMLRKHGCSINLPKKKKVP